jgi:hypothetical protein
MSPARIIAVAAILGGASACAPTSAAAPAHVVAIPGGKPGVGFDDLRFSARLGVLVPAARTGAIAVIDAKTLAVRTIGGFATATSFDGGHDFGVTSVDDTGRWLLAVDRTTQQVHVVDPGGPGIVASAALAHGPDYVRWVASRHEVWVTEPDAEVIEIFALDDAGARPALRHLAELAVRGGPESLVVDDAGGRAYAHLWHGATVAIDLAARAIVATWKNGCDGSRGIALDAGAGLLFAACSEGGAAVLDVKHDGAIRGRVKAGRGVDVIDYSPSLHHLYLPAATDATVTVAAVAKTGALTALGRLAGARGGHCGTTDDRGHVFVCVPDTGAIVVADDRWPATSW